MKNKIVLLKDGKKIFQMYVKSSRNSALGDSDIMLDTGKGIYFENVVLGNYFRFYTFPQYKINSISWHGYYKTFDEFELFSPVVHLKSHDVYIDKICHLGSINNYEPIAFPVCSLYVPNNFNTSNIGTSKKNYEKCFYIELPKSQKTIRYDFFVLPKGVSLDKFNKSSIIHSYIYEDLEVFNIPEAGSNMLLDSRIKEIGCINGNDVFIRIVSDPSNIQKVSDTKKQIFEEISNDFTIILNDPNDIYHKLTDYLVVEWGNNGLQKPTTLKKLHEDEIGKVSDCELVIWEELRNKI